MTTLTLQRSAVSLSVIAMLGACGGGGNGGDVASSATAQREQAQALTVGSVGAKELFDWAQYKYPTLFAKGPQNQPFSYLGTNYTIRAYPNGNYLGLTTGGDVYGLGPFNNNVLTQYGTLAGFAAAVVADECLVTPTAAGCTSPVPSGPLNQCIDPISANPPAGFRLHLVYDLSGSATGEQVSDTLVDGTAAFEGQNATQTTTTSSNTISIPGFPTPNTTTAKVKSYTQPSTTTPGLFKNLGVLAEATTASITFGGITVPGTTTSSKSVYTPPYENLEYTLQVGQSVTINSTQVITGIQPVSAPLTSSYRQTYTFEAVETITVLGRSFNTCRYRISENGTDFSTSWAIVGKGVAAKVQSGTGSNLTVLQLKPGSTYNGAAL